MNKFISYASGGVFAATVLWTQVASAALPAASECASKAVSKDGKPLSGAAKTAFMKKCEVDAKAGK